MANAETSELNLVLKFKKLVEAGKGGAIVKNDRIVDSLGNIYIHATVSLNILLVQSCYSVSFVS